MNYEDDTYYTTTDGKYRCSYCSPKQVMESIRIIDFNDPNMEIMEPSDSTHPSYDELVYRISVNESKIDRLTKNSWRPNVQKGKMYSIGRYWHDNNSVRDEYYRRGGYAVQLRKDILPWDPSKGDKLEIRTALGGQWRDVTNLVSPDGRDESTGIDAGEYSFWFDYVRGILYVRYGGYMNSMQNAVRITYRYGREGEEIPPEITRVCSLMTALMILNEELYMTKIGQGGDLGGNKNELKKAMQDEINEIIGMHRRVGAVYSLYQ